MQSKSIPEMGFLSLAVVLGLIPVGKSTWWAGIREGRYPAPVRISRHRVAWRAGDILSLVERLGAEGEGA